MGDHTLSPEDSLVAPAKSSPLKAIVAVVAIAGVAATGWWLLGGGKGQPEDPARVLIVGPTPELAGFLEREGFDVDHLSVGEAVGEGQAFDASLDALAAMLEYADQRGYGYLALNMAHGEQYEFASVGYQAGDPPAGTTFAVMSVGDLGTSLSFGGVVPEVAHQKPAGEQVGLLLALFQQAPITKARTREADNDLMIRFGSAGTVEDVLEYESSQENMRRQIAAWTALAEAERGDPKPTELARPYEPLRGWPLANGQILLAGGREAWRSDDGRSSTIATDELEAALTVVSPDALGERVACESLPETLAIDGGFAVAPAGDALLIPSDRGVADLWVLAGESCRFEKRAQIRRLADGELGLPRASGRTATTQNGRLTWADAQMRRYRQVRIPGVDLRHGELHWIGEQTVVMPAQLDFVTAAEARARRIASEAKPEGPLPELPAIDPATVPASREALIFVKLPPPKQDDDLQLAVVPVDALLVLGAGAGAGEPSALSIRDVFPLPASEGSVVALIDATDGSRLIEIAIADDSPLWRNALAIDYDLAPTAKPKTGAIVPRVLADELPPQAHDLAISPTGSHAAWAAPFGDPPGDDAPLGNFEIVLLPLGQEHATPIRLTDNARSDLRPRFAGAQGRTLIFDSRYAASDDLAPIESLRALPVPN